MIEWHVKTNKIRFVTRVKAKRFHGLLTLRLDEQMAEIYHTSFH